MMGEGLKKRGVKKSVRVFFLRVGGEREKKKTEKNEKKNRAKKNNSFPHPALVELQPRQPLPRHGLVDRPQRRLHHPARGPEEHPGPGLGRGRRRRVRRRRILFTISRRRRRERVVVRGHGQRRQIRHAPFLEHLGQLLGRDDVVDVPHPSPLVAGPVCLALLLDARHHRDDPDAPGVDAHHARREVLLEHRAEHEVRGLAGADVGEELRGRGLDEGDPAGAAGGEHREGTVVVVVRRKR